jgi:pyruvate dehydrogenase E2 component (dihydrolipoamide acetyltransferase)
MVGKAHSTIFYSKIQVRYMFTIKMPQAGKKMTKGTVAKWLKQTGQAVKKGEAILQVESDEGLIEIESGLDGAMGAILVAAGKTVAVDTPIGEIDANGQPTSNPSSVQPAAAPVKKEIPAMPTNVIPVLMPKAGQSVEEATIVKWHVKPGDQIKKGQVIFEIETDKATMEVEATDGGRLARIVLPEGGSIKVLEPVGFLADKDSDVDAYLAAAGGVPAVSAAPAAAAPKAPVQGPKGVVIPVLMPKAGQSVEEATLVKWHVKPGDVIKKGQVIFEIETDKATMEVEATDEGKLQRITLPEGGVISVLQPVGYIADNDADVDAYIAVQAAESGVAAAPVQAAVATSAAPAVTARAAVSEGGRVKASPAARKFAAERGINLAGLPAGSGPDGRIISNDVPATATATSSTKAAVPAASAPTAAPIPVAASGEAVRSKMSNMRKAIARNLLYSKQNIPHFYIKTTIDAGPMYSFYKQEKAKYQCSVNDVVILACAKAIQEFPVFKSQIDAEKSETVEFPNSNIGIAVGLDKGLVVPVLMAAETLNLQQIGSESKRLAGLAKGGKIENMGKGVFTISNMGMFGVPEFTPIINPPEAAIMGVGAIRDDVIVSGGAIRAGRVMTMTLSVDHRIIDGMVAAQFLARLKEMLECPEQLA